MQSVVNVALRELINRMTTQEPTLLLQEPTLLLQEPTLLLQEPTLLLQEPTLLLQDPTHCCNGQCFQCAQIVTLGHFALVHTLTLPDYMLCVPLSHPCIQSEVSGES